MAPQPGEYGPVPWSVPRPMTLWLAAGLVVLIQVVQSVGSHDRAPFAWVFLIGIVYLMLRGSKLMWWLGVVLGILGSLGSIQSSFANRGSPGLMTPSPNTQLIVGILTAMFVIVLLLPSTRHFFDLEWRRQHLPATTPT